jgi:hypothetical protein
MVEPAPFLPFDVIVDIAKETVVASALFVMECHSKATTNRASAPKTTRRRTATRIQRTRRSVEEVYKTLGPLQFRRYYRMTYESFMTLHDKLKDGILDAVHKMWYNRSTIRSSTGPPAAAGGRGRGNFHLKKQCGNYQSPPITNGVVSSTVRLACAIRYFAGGSPGDLMGMYCVSYSFVMDAVWQVVTAVNNLHEFYIEYPADQSAQRKIAATFCEASAVKFDNCAGAIDGILIWTNKPTMKDSQKSGLGPKKLYCGRKHKFGLNCQVVSDKRGRILDISMVTGGSTADCLALEASALYKRLENGLLQDGLVFFGDNAYLNTMYMATPYTNVAEGSKDNYNYYHSQLRIRVECCFGMLTQKWGILRTAMPQNMSVRRIVALVSTLAKLHNYCIDQKDDGTTTGGKELMVNNPLDLQVDKRVIENSVDGFVDFEVIADKDSGGFTEHTGVTLQVPMDLIGGGHHRDDVPRNRRQLPPEHEQSLPRTLLHDVVLHSHKVRPSLRGTKVPLLRT